MTDAQTRIGRAAMFVFRATTMAALTTLSACCDSGSAAIYGGPPAPPGTSLAAHGAPSTPILVPPPPPTTEAPATVEAPVSAAPEPILREVLEDPGSAAYALYGAAPEDDRGIGSLGGSGTR